MAKDRYYTPAQSFPGIIAMSVALTIIAGAVFGPKAVADDLQKSAGILWDAGANVVRHGPEIVSNFMQMIQR